MFGLFNKCNHYWHMVGKKFNFWGDDYVIIYCPKCDKTKKVLPEKYKIMMNIQKIQDEYGKI